MQLELIDAQVLGQLAQLAVLGCGGAAGCSEVALGQRGQQLLLQVLAGVLGGLHQAVAGLHALLQGVAGGGGGSDGGQAHVALGSQAAAAALPSVTSMWLTTTPLPGGLIGATCIRNQISRSGVWQG